MGTTLSYLSMVAVALAWTCACASDDKSARTTGHGVDASVTGGANGMGGSSSGGSVGSGGASGGDTGTGGSRADGGSSAGGAPAGGASGRGGSAGAGAGGVAAGGSSGSAGRGSGGTQSGGSQNGGSQNGGTAGGGGRGGGGGGKGGSAGTGGGTACGTSTCGAGEICITGRCAGCCNLPPSCIPIPSGCSETLGCGCFATDPCGACTRCQTVTPSAIVCGNCMCVCAAAWSPVATPGGPRRIADLQVGDLVYTVDHGERVAAPIVRVNRRPVSRHALVRVTLADGSLVEMSGGHPTADGRRFDALTPGGRLGRSEIVSLETVPYDEPFTYDILPASDTGTYFVGDGWVGSTLHDGHCGE